jgi:uncharacterized protein YutE (UPF0331/DUF86 family)/predicted nucleotidyltransferase
MKRLHHKVREERQRIAQRLATELEGDGNVAFAYLYGSFLDSTPFHDIDVGVYLDNVRVVRTTARDLDLAQRLSDTARMLVDVRILNVAPVSFLYHVLRGQLLFCRDDAGLAEVMEQAISRYLDIAPGNPGSIFCMKLNPDLIRARCNEIGESVSRLERLQGLSREQFLADQDTLDIACYRLLVAIEAALALCYHVSATRLRKVPEEYAECFGILREASILPEELAGRLQQMARFRNLLVHMYWKIDYGRVFDVLHDNLNDLRAFSGAVLRLL